MTRRVVRQGDLLMRINVIGHRPQRRRMAYLAAGPLPTPLQHWWFYRRHAPGIPAGV